MHRLLPVWLTLAAILSSCSGKTTPSISVVCEENSVGNCIVRWEMSPMQEGYMRVYRATSPDADPDPTPVAGADIKDGKVVVVTDNPLMRYYYTLVFNDKYSVKVASRNVNIDGVQNFRDIGGYRSDSLKRNLRWNMIYRSAHLDSLNTAAQKELRNIGIKTVIDLRTEDEKADSSRYLKGVKYVNAPIAVTSLRRALRMIDAGKVERDTINVLMERFNREIVSQENADGCRKIFNTLLDTDSYPVVVMCTSGTGRTGVVTAILLTILGVNEDVIEDDYCLSNTYYNISKAKQIGYKLPTNSQEAITTIYTAKKEFLRAAREEIKLNYGGAATYLHNTIGLKQEDVERLRDILIE